MPKMIKGNLFVTTRDFYCFPDAETARSIEDNLLSWFWVFEGSRASERGKLMLSGEKFLILAYRQKNRCIKILDADGMIAYIPAYYRRWVEEA